MIDHFRMTVFCVGWGCFVLGFCAAAFLAWRER